MSGPGPPVHIKRVLLKRWDAVVKVGTSDDGGRVAGPVVEQNGA